MKYDPISRCKPRNNSIDFISISASRVAKHDANGGIGWISGLDRGKKDWERRWRGEGEGGWKSNGSKEEAFWRSPGAYRRDANTGPKGTYRATNVGRSACTSRRGGVVRRGETRETEQRHCRRWCRWNEVKGWGEGRKGCRWIEEPLVGVTE